MEAYKGRTPDSPEGRAVAAMKSVTETLEGFFTDTALDAGENYQAAGEQKNTTQEGGVDGNKYSIREGMTDQERYEELRHKQITVISDSRTADYSGEIASLEALETKAKSKAEKIIKPLAKKLGIINMPLSTTDVETTFLFTTSQGLSESLHKQIRYGGSYVDFAKTLINLDNVLKSAILIEAHGDKYAGTARANEHLEAVYVLFGAFKDGNSIIPVQMEIKKTSDIGGRLYLTVAMTKIEAGVVGSTPGENQARSLLPASEYNLADIFSKINPKDGHFLKYLPDGFLNEEQIQAKKTAIGEDEARISGYKNKAPALPRQYQDGTAKAENRPVRVPTDASETRVAQAEDNVKEKFSLRQDVTGYSYESLVSKPDMAVTTLDSSVLDSRADIVAQAKKNAARIGKFNTKDGSVSVHVNDIDTDVLLTTAGLRHGLDRRLNVNAPVTVMIGEILQNSIRINEMNPSKATASESYVLIGAARTTEGQLYVVRSVVNRFNNEVSSVDVLYAMNAKTEVEGTKKRNQAGDNPQGSRFNNRFLTGSSESAAPKAPRLAAEATIRTDSTISIAELLDSVNENFPDVLPEDVLKHYGYDARPEGKLGESALYSERNPELEKVNRVLEKENIKLKADVSYLKEMVKLQKQVTGGTKFTKTSVEEAAGQLMRYAGAKGSKTELAGLLNSVYEYIAKGEELTWEGVKEAARPAVEWLQKHVKSEEQLDSEM